MRAPTRAPTRADFPVFSPSRTPHETSHEGVHGRAHEWMVGVDLSCFHLFCSLTSDFENFRAVSRFNQEGPRQTKPKKGQFMNFSQGHSGTKVRYVNRACFPKEKHQNSQNWAKFMNFSFWPFLWFGLQGRLS